MKSIKTLSFTALAALAATAPADAYFRAAFRIDKTYRQMGVSSAPSFLSGSAYLYVVDGVATQTGCEDNGIATPFPINTEKGCNIGSNAAVVGLGSPATAYYEIATLEAAQTIEPGRQDLISLYARPYSDFPSKISGVTSNQISIFYDLTSTAGTISQYRLTGAGLAGNEFLPGYSYIRNYTSRSTMEKEIVEGVYSFKFPKINYPNTAVYLNFPVKNTVEGYVNKPVKGGFRFTNVPSYNSAGFAEFGANEPLLFQWEGLINSLVLGSDRLYVSFRQLTNDANPSSPTVSNDLNGILFPPQSLTSNNVRVLLPSPVTTQFAMPGDYLNYRLRTERGIASGRCVMRVELLRDAEINLSVASARYFELPIELVETFSGAMAAAFPENTSASVMSRDADPDGDGIPNWVEWLAGTDPTKANAPKTLSSMSYVAPSAARDSEVTEGYWQMTLDRPANLTEKVTIAVESSTDLKTWSTITSSNTEWQVIDDKKEPQLRVVSKKPGLVEKRYFRVKYNYAG